MSALPSIPLFSGISPEDLSSLLQCLGAVQRYYHKDETIFREGEVIEQLGVVLTGRVFVQCSDVFGNVSILGNPGPGSVFGEAYACCPGEPLQVSVIAAEGTEILFLNVNRILTTCPSSCIFHAQLVRNLLTICAQKSLELSRRMLHTTPKTIRGRLLSYFSECAKKERNSSFELCYNRQQLADHLGVDRSALCAELSKMQKDGLIQYHKNHINILQDTTDPI